MAGSLHDIFQKDAETTLEVLAKAKKRELFDSQLFMSVVLRTCSYLPEEKLAEGSTGFKELVDVIRDGP